MRIRATGARVVFRWCVAGTLSLLAQATPVVHAGNAKHAPEIAAAQKAAAAWLQPLDAEHYDVCWKQSAAFFQQKVPQAAFQKRMETIRKPLDPVVTRTLTASEYKKQLPGLPKGEYVALVWQTVFSNSQESLESLVMVDEQGQWKMTGYAVQ
jgi:Protein of unknown function (DUF4019)